MSTRGAASRIRADIQQRERQLRKEREQADYEMAKELITNTFVKHFEERETICLETLFQNFKIRKKDIEEKMPIPCFEEQCKKLGFTLKGDVSENYFVLHIPEYSSKYGIPKSYAQKLYTMYQRKLKQERKEAIKEIRECCILVLRMVRNGKYTLKRFGSFKYIIYVQVGDQLYSKYGHFATNAANDFFAAHGFNLNGILNGTWRFELKD